MDPVRYAYGYRRVVEVSVLVGAGIAVATATCAPLAITVIAGPRFDEAVGLLQLLAGVLLLKFVTTAIGFGLLAGRRYSAVLVANLAALATAVTVCAITIPSYGGAGGAIAALASECVVGALYLWFMRRQIVVFRQALPIGLTVMAAAGVAAATMALPGPAIVSMVLGPLVFVASVVGAGAVPREVVDAVPLLPRFASRRLGA
jgi:O-antigen/teichoic acid export membrane protein